MATFKEFYQEDLDNVFFDEEEFAERHTIDGKECVIILTDETRQRPYLRRTDLNPKETAVNKTSQVIYIRDKELERKVTSGAMINLDGNKYFVQDVSHKAGVYRLVVGIHKV